MCAHQGSLRSELMLPTGPRCGVVEGAGAVPGLGGGSGGLAPVLLRGLLFGRAELVLGMYDPIQEGCFPSSFWKQTSSQGKWKW